QDEKTGYLPNSMYHHGFATLALSEAYGNVDESLLWEGQKPTRSIAQTLDLAIRCAETAQKKNRWGGWRYSPDSTDADTSVTGAVLMGLMAARNAGMDVADETIHDAMEYMRRSTGKDGAVAYSGGFGAMGGSMNLSAVATLVGAVSRSKDTDQYKASLKRLTDSLDDPSNGNNFPEYFRYYMAQALFQGDYQAWQKWNAAVVRELHDAQHDDGSFASGAYGTGMSLLALALNYRFLPIYER
ncbi:MAG TPA: squalene--hopene cyclase, partial [Chthoniobacteraceae bacterium]